MSFFTKLLALKQKIKLPHTQLPGVFMENDVPGEFVGGDYRIKGADGLKDDRVRNANNYVAYAPRKVIPDLIGGGTLVSEDHPQSTAKGLDSEITEANTPRQTRGEKLDTLTEVHDSQRTFDVAVSAFKDTVDRAPPDDKPAAWDGTPNPTTQQPENPFNAKYPYNHVRETESGHLFEADDTPGSERIKESHRSGTYYEVFPDGTKVEKIVRDNFTVIVGHDKVNIQGSAVVTIEGDCNFYTKGNFTHQVDGDYNLLVKGKYTEQIADEVTHDHHSNYFHYVGNTIDPTKAGKGRGNEGGNVKIEYANDYKLNVEGVTIETYGNAKAFENNNTITTRNTILFGDLEEEIRGGGKKEIVAENSSEAIGGNHVMAVIGNSTETIDANHVMAVVGNSTETIDKNHNITVTGNKTQTIKGDGGYTTTSTKATIIKGSTIDLNPP
jgi:hypothetical protein